MRCDGSRCRARQSWPISSASGTPSISGRARETSVRHPLPEIQEVPSRLRGLADQSLGEARVRERFGVNVVSITRGDARVIIDPDAETMLRAGDRVRAFGLPAHIDAFRARRPGSLSARPRRALGSRTPVTRPASERHVSADGSAC